MINFDNVTYYYPDSREPVLRNLSLQIEEGEFILVVGSSGAGKTTFLRCLNGLIPHFYGGRFAGGVTIFGKNSKDYSVADLSLLVGFVFQDSTAQCVTEKVESEIAFGLENLGLSTTVIRKRIEETLDQLGLAHLRNRHINTLSGGERQKVAIGSALAMQPRILVLDEPTSELDPNSAEEVLTLLQKLNHDLGLTVILSEHRLERVVQYADRIVEIEKGVLRAGSLREMLSFLKNVPPLIALGRRMNWQSLPLTVKEGKKFTQKSNLNLNFMFRKEGRSNKEKVLEVRDLSFSHDGEKVLKGINFEAGQGEYVALMGRNGAGKTTLLKNICGLLRPQKGMVKISGKDTKNSSQEEIARQIGYVPQRPSMLLFSETVEDELKCTLKLRHLDFKGIPRILKFLQLERYAQVYPRDLSLGEQQRVALGAILVAEPPVILLDEPTHGLDYQNKELLVSILKGLQKQEKTIILATHDVELVARSADRVVLLAEGELVIDGDKREALSESILFSPQINKLFGGKVMTVEDVFDAMGLMSDQR